MGWTEVAERQHQADVERAERRDDAVASELERVEAQMRRQVAHALEVQDLTRPIVAFSPSTGECTFEVGYAQDIWWSEHYESYLLSPAKPLWDAFLDYWIETYALDVANDRIK